MRNCLECGQPFDNEHWFLASTPEGEPELSVVRNARCETCWKRLTEAVKDNPSGCRLFLGDDPLEPLAGTGWVTDSPKREYSPPVNAPEPAKLLLLKLYEVVRRQRRARLLLHILEHGTMRQKALILLKAVEALPDDEA